MQSRETGLQRPNSLLTGKFTGNFATFGSGSVKKTQETSVTMGTYGVFLCSSKQGISVAEQGISRRVIRDSFELSSSHSRESEKPMGAIDRWQGRCGFG